MIGWLVVLAAGPAFAAVIVVSGRRQTRRIDRLVHQVPHTPRRPGSSQPASRRVAKVPSSVTTGARTRAASGSPGREILAALSGIGGREDAAVSTGRREGQMTDTESIKALDLRFMNEVLNEHNLNALSELVAEDFIEQNPAPGQGPGREGLRHILAQQFEAFPDMRWGVEEIVAEGDRVAGWGTWEGTHRGTFMGIPPTGRTVSVEYWTMDYIRDGKIAESRIIMDVMGLMQQLGAIPGHASAEATGAPA
jgi:steroid delta-isomerase-like uncharacterized protein